MGFPIAYGKATLGQSFEVATREDHPDFPHQGNPRAAGKRGAPPRQPTP